MSIESVRRPKERGGAGGKIPASLPTKTLTPVSQKPSFSSGARRSTGKENPNPRSISRVSGPTQKPDIRPMVRMSTGDGDPRSSSRPRGRSPSPSDFTRILCDLRKTRVASDETFRRSGVSKVGLVSSGGKPRALENMGSGDLSHRVCEKGGIRVSTNRKDNGNVGQKLSDSGKEVSGEETAGKLPNDKHKKEVALLGNYVNPNVNGVQDASDGCIDHCIKDGNLITTDKKEDYKGDNGKQNVLRAYHAPSMKRNVIESSFRESGMSNLISKGASVSKEKGVSKDGTSDRASNERASKLHEKLAFLEGKVKKIASDIKKTKEILDVNNTNASKVMISDIQQTISGIEEAVGNAIADFNTNVNSDCTGDLNDLKCSETDFIQRKIPDIKKTKEILDMNNTNASKVMISDIQQKISGIEEAVGNAIADFNTNVNSDCPGDLSDSKCWETDIIQRTIPEANQNKQAEPAKLSVESLSGEELEARLFPHHKLLKDRTLLKLSASGLESDAIHLTKSNSGSNSVKLMSPIDENSIAIEFLASLNEQSGVAIDGGVGDNVTQTGDAETSTAGESSDSSARKQNTEVDLQADENLDEFDDQENKPSVIVEADMDDDSLSQLVEIGHKTSTGGWFISEGESILLAHDDGSCSFHDVANREEKAEYRPPAAISKNLWQDCWIIRAPSADGCSEKYVVAASAGNTTDSGFCSWDFYSKEVRAFHTEDNKTTAKSALGRLPDNIGYRRNVLADITPSPNQQWWYRPCGPLMISTATCQRAVKVFDIRDGQKIMKWDVQKHVLAMDYCSPLQWRNKGKVVIAEIEGVSLWDVSSMNSQALSSASNSGRRISALHVNNTDAELGGGVRQRVSSSEAEGNDGVFCTSDSINILDFRHPSGIGLKIPKVGVSVDCVFSRGDSVFLGCSGVSSAAKKQVSSQVLQFSLRKQKIVSTYQLPESSAHSHHKALSQVWGNSNLVMAVCGLGLVVFDAQKDDVLPSFAIDYSNPQNAKEVIGPDDLYMPSFDYHSSHVLLISRDRSAMYRHLS